MARQAQESSRSGEQFPCVKGGTHGALLIRFSYMSETAPVKPKKDDTKKSVWGKVPLS
jgi:hypothetical protein